MLPDNRSQTTAAEVSSRLLIVKYKLIFDATAQNNTSSSRETSMSQLLIRILTKDFFIIYLVGGMNINRDSNHSNGTRMSKRTFCLTGFINLRSLLYLATILHYNMLEARSSNLFDKEITFSHRTTTNFFKEKVLGNIQKE